MLIGSVMVRCSAAGRGRRSKGGGGAGLSSAEGKWRCIYTAGRRQRNVQRTKPPTKHPRARRGIRQRRKALPFRVRVCGAGSNQDL